MNQKEEKRVEKAAAEERRNNEINHWKESHFFGVEKIATSPFFLIIRKTTFSRVFFVCIVYTKYRHMYVTYRVMADSDKPSMRTPSMPCVL